MASRFTPKIQVLVQKDFLKLQIELAITSQLLMVTLLEYIIL